MLSMSRFHVLLSLGLFGLAGSPDSGAAEPVVPAVVVEEETETDAIAPSELADLAPSPGLTPEATARALYGTQSFLHQRGTFNRKVVDHFQVCFTSALNKHLYLFSDALEAWKVKHAGQQLKLPLTEGSIFISCYEGCTTYQVGKAIVLGDMARVPVVMKHFEQGEPYGWVDMAVLRRVGKVWLLDEVVFDAGASDGSLREHLSMEPHEIEELLGKQPGPVPGLQE